MVTLRHAKQARRRLAACALVATHRGTRYRKVRRWAVSRWAVLQLQALAPRPRTRSADCRWDPTSSRCSTTAVGMHAAVWSWESLPRPANTVHVWHEADWSSAVEHAPTPRCPWCWTTVRDTSVSRGSPSRMTSG